MAINNSSIPCNACHSLHQGVEPYSLFLNLGLVTSFDQYTEIEAMLYQFWSQNLEA